MSIEGSPTVESHKHVKLLTDVRGALRAALEAHKLETSFQNLRHRQEASKLGIGYVSSNMPARRRRIVDPRFVAWALASAAEATVQDPVLDY